MKLCKLKLFLLVTVALSSVFLSSARATNYCNWLQGSVNGTGGGNYYSPSAGLTFSLIGCPNGYQLVGIVLPDPSTPPSVSNGLCQATCYFYSGNPVPCEYQNQSNPDQVQCTS